MKEGTVGKGITRVQRLEMLGWASTDLRASAGDTNLRFLTSFAYFIIGYSMGLYINMKIGYAQFSLNGLINIQNIFLWTM